MTILPVATMLNIISKRRVVHNYILKTINLIYIWTARLGQVFRFSSLKATELMSKFDYFNYLRYFSAVNNVTIEWRDARWI